LQTTLLGLAIAIILALVTALVGPLFVDWGSYRGTFETEAAKLVGTDVRIAGAIDARLLPSPRLTLQQVAVGEGDRAMRARALTVEFALGPLMRGEWRASELHLVEPEAKLGLDATGRAQVPSLALAFDPNGVGVERLTIVGGKLVLIDGGGSAITLDNLSFVGDARTLLGPFKGEGALSIDGEQYAYRLGASRYGDDGTLKLRVTADPGSRRFGLDVDGVMALANAAPKFEGTVTLARPVAITAGGVSQPWRLTGKVKADAQGALLEQLEFRYGSEERGLTLTGVADFKFGTNPRFDGILSGRQIDLDQALASADGARLQPAAAVRQFAELVGGAIQPRIPVQIGVGIDQITLGGGTVQNLRGDIGSDAGGWTLNGFEFRAPGLTQVRLSGQLTATGDSVSFSGPAEINASDPKTLASWLTGEGDIAPGDLRSLTLKGDLTLGRDKIAIERLQAEFDKRPVQGRLLYVLATPNQPAKLEAELKAPQLDLDGLIGFGNALLAGTAVEAPHDLTIAADIGRMTVAGFLARDTSVRMKLDSSGLQVDRLVVADVDGVALSINGRIVGTAPAPNGSLQLDMNARDMTPVMALLARFAPGTAEVVGSVAPGMAPARLQARLTIDGAAAATQARLVVSGTLGKVRLALNAQTEADPIAFSLGDIGLDARLQADEGKALIAMLGLDRIVAVGAGPATFSLKANGPVLGEQKIESWLTGAGLSANVAGTTRVLDEKPSAALRATIVNADLAPLRAGRGGVLPVTLTTRVAIAGDKLSLADLSGTMAGARVRGRLDYGWASPHRVSGEVEAERIDASSLVAAAIGLPSPADKGSKAPLAWSDQPFAAGAFGAFDGMVAVKAAQAELLPAISAREFRAGLKLGTNEIVLDGVSGVLAGGRLAGQMSLRRAPNGVAARLKLSVAGADAAGVILPGAGAPVSGKLDFSGELEGSGLSPVALIGALQGSAKFSFSDGGFAWLNPRAFESVTLNVDGGLPIEAARIRRATAIALEGGAFPFKRVEGNVAFGAGQARMPAIKVDTNDATLSLSGGLDLTDGALDGRMVMTGANLAAGAHPDIFMSLGGPLNAPVRNIDAAALTAWLTLRSVEMQSEKLREMERQREQEEKARQEEMERARQQAAERARLQQEEMDRVRQQQLQQQPQQAPALPPPLDIKPAPTPRSSGQPAASVGPQN